MCGGCLSTGELATHWSIQNWVMLVYWRTQYTVCSVLHKPWVMLAVGIPRPVTGSWQGGYHMVSINLPFNYSLQINMNCKDTLLGQW